MQYFQKPFFVIISRNKTLLFFFILGASFFLRLYHLGYRDFWYDEVYTAFYSQYSYIFWKESLYNVLLHFWVQLFGVSEFSLRFPSFIFSFLSVILVFFLGRELFNKNVGIFASIFIGLSPFQLWYAQEARVYSMVLFLGLLSSFLFFKAITRKQSWLWLTFVLISILGLYTNYFYILLFIAQGLYLIFSIKFRFYSKELIYFLIIAICFSYCLDRFFFTVFYFFNGCWIPSPTWKAAIITLENFILGYNGLSLAYFISNILVVLFLVSAFRSNHDRKIKTGLIVCIYLLLIPLFLAFIFSKIFFPVYLDRCLIIFSPYFYLILSSGLESLKRSIKIFTISILISLLFLCDYRYLKDYISSLNHHLGVHLKQPVKPAIEFLRSNLDSQDIIAVTSESIFPLFKFYMQKESSRVYFFFVPEVNSSITQVPLGKSLFITQRPIDEGGPPVPFYKTDRLKFKRLWVISSNWDKNNGVDENSKKMKERLDSKFKLDFANKLDSLWIYRYSRF